MTEENKVQTDVNPEGSQPLDKDEAGVENRPFHEHPRWKEMIGERDSLRERNAQLEESQGVLNSKLEVVTKQVSDLTGSKRDEAIRDRAKAIGVDEQHIPEFIKFIEDVSASKPPKPADSPNVSARDKAIDGALSVVSRRADYKNLEETAIKEFKKLSPALKQAIAQDKTGTLMNDHYENVKKIVNVRSDKETLNKKKGVTPEGVKVLSREVIAGMSMEEYEKRLPEINAWLANGLI